MEEIVIKVEVPSEMREEFKVALSKVVEELIRKIRVMKLEELRKDLESDKEKEFTKWSVDLGRKVKKGRFKRLLAELPAKEREILSR